MSTIPCAEEPAFTCTRPSCCRWGVASASSHMLWLLLVVVAAAAGATPVLLDFEGVGDLNQVGNFYSGGGGGPDYGIVFAAGVVAGVDSDAGGTSPIAGEPSPSTAVKIAGPESQAYVTVLGGFTGMSFQYASDTDVSVTVFTGPNRTGTALATSVVPGFGFCSEDDCGDPKGTVGAWFDFTVSFVGEAKSAGFSTDSGGRLLYVDDMVFAVPKPPTNAPTKPPTRSPTNAPTNDPTDVPTNDPTDAHTNAPTDAPTKPPTKAPTKRPTRFPTKAPTMICRMGMKGNQRCMKKKKAKAE
jgi:PT repeat